jgi:hypothetical protein
LPFDTLTIQLAQREPEGRGLASREGLVPSLDLVHRVTEAATACTIARMRVLEGIPGNPIGIAFRICDNVVAPMARHLPSPPFNSVVGLRRGQANHIRPLVEWYREPRPQVASRCVLRIRQPGSAKPRRRPGVDEFA